jgi:hypothetical protein
MGGLSVSSLRMAIQIPSANLAGASRPSMRPAFEQIDEAAAEGGLGSVAGIDEHEVADGAGERKAVDLPDAERCFQAIANLDQDNFIAAAAFARRVTALVIVIGVLREIGREVFALHRHER